MDTLRRTVIAGTCMLLAFAIPQASAQTSNNHTPTAQLNGTGTTNFLALWASKSDLANSVVQQNGSNIGIGLSPRFTLDVAGDINFTGKLLFNERPLMQVGTSGNLSLGLQAFAANTGYMNTANGFAALTGNTGGTNNAAFGSFALTQNLTGSFNTGIGFNALRSNAIGMANTGLGTAALQLNSTGDNNTGAGSSAMSSNTTGSSNTAVGTKSLFHSSTGDHNTAVGFNALGGNVSGNENIAIGFEAGANVGNSGDFNIEIGNSGTAADVRVIRVGTPLTQNKFFAAGIRGTTTGMNDAVPVMIDSQGQLGTISSSIRFKEDVHDMGAASRPIMQLRPVTYRYREPYQDGSKPVQYGLVAEEVAQVFPEMVAHSANGDVETVKYQMLEPMLLNEIQRQETEIEGLKDQIHTLEKIVEKMQAKP